MKPWKLLLALALALVVGKLGYWGWQEWQLRQPGFHETACWFSKRLTGDARCGYMVVPENRQVAESRLIRLPVVIFDAAQPKRWHYEEPGAPVLYLTGGPGGQAYIGEQDDVDSWFFERRIFAGHDLIVMGQRGTGLKEPDFDCEEFDTPALFWGAHKRGTPPPDELALLVEAAEACIGRLQADGIDLTAYNSRESAADVAALRRALGIEEWNLYGVSYGTRLALSVLRYEPEGVRAVILDSVFPPEATSLIDGAAYFQTALQRFLADCNTFTDCDVQPDSGWTRYISLREELADNPIELDLSAIDPDTDLIVTLDERVFDRLVFLALYAKESREALRKAISGLAETGGGRNGEVPARMLLQEYLDGILKGSDAVYLSYICHDEVTFETPTQIAEAAREAGTFGHFITEDDAAVLCPLWPSGRAEPIENTPVTSDVPALLLAGAFDPVTPPILARSAAAGLPQGYLFEFQKAGHGVVYEIDCIAELIGDFLLEPIREPAGPCRKQAFLASEPNRLIQRPSQAASGYRN